MNSHLLFQLLACLIFLTCLASLLVICGITFTPFIKKNSPSEEDSKKEKAQVSLIEKIIYVENWKNKRFVIWALATPCALFGYFVPFVHLVN